MTDTRDNNVIKQVKDDYCFIVTTSKILKEYFINLKIEILLDAYTSNLTYVRCQRGPLPKYLLTHFFVHI